MKVSAKPRIVVAYNRDFEGAEADPENRAREDIEGIAQHVGRILGGAGFEVIPVGVTGEVLVAMDAITRARPAAVFNLCESIQGDNRFEAVVPLLLELQGIPFTGSGSFALSVALRKDRVKEVLRARGISSPRGVTLRSPEIAGALATLRLPVIVKPTREDASVGISSASVVRDAAALDARVRHVLDHYRQPVLVEEFVEGREIYVSLLGRKGDRPEVLPHFEIDFSDLPPDRPRIVSFEGKWVEDSAEYKGTRPIRCEGLGAGTRARLEETALAAFEALEARDYGRVDIRLAADGTPYVIDVNPNCDLSADAGGFARAARAGGMTYDEVILRLLDLALHRRPHADPPTVAQRSRSADPARRPGDGEPVPA